ncbi:BZ3500_MvSof-1268-A1-R1_Chr1-3g02017 [Microbotryum saponariae]|uniref:Mitochondrial inner membrane protease subunit 2 n=1 Tax=Microbotryum saponariae TaxID=289078 RepID=A0A2X0KN21_9BASI|nr:BZ3500_MvSof-1268-A1-R1_Chr1-3g02017 [Microbotryum saponariae]SCZ95162.1 BZ3501_MvSof-1269-A2-R1_Chr1-3g01619 [Microbotryum saponariae]
MASASRARPTRGPNSNPNPNPTGSSSSSSSSSSSGPRARLRTHARPWLNALAWLPVIFFVDHHLVSFATVSGRSMQPTLNPDSSKLRQDIVLLNRYKNLELTQGATRTDPKAGYQIGDVVALRYECFQHLAHHPSPARYLRSPTNPSQLLIKRLVGLPGSLVRTLPPYPERTIRIPAGHCWVEGDEKNHSKDSNTYGPIPLGLLDSRIEAILWPPSRIGAIPKSTSGWEKRVMHPPGMTMGSSTTTSSESKTSTRVIGGSF